MKQLIIDEITGRLKALQIPYALSGDSVTVGTEFVEIGESSDLKKVRYDLTITVDETSRSVVVYVSTVDKYIITADGTLPPGESGKPAHVFRKVKHIMIGPDGESTLVTLDLADIPNTAKACAVRYGWKFSTVLNMSKKPPVLLSASERVKELRINEDMDLSDVYGLVDELTVPKRPRRKKGGFFSRLFRRKK
ncbi:MAG: hypothetical protein GX189_05060 [Clostridiales bacterium]|nr:hypothetical protein [Clostridiales bacterium]